VKTIAWSKLVREHRGQILAVGMCLLYLVVYLTTTHLKPQGMGGLSGPEEVRVFRSETHLVPFYPLYLLERWIRNQSFVYATYPFNCDFADHLYVHHWLYGDGKYSIVWYDNVEGVFVFLAVLLPLAFGLWKMSGCKVWIAGTVGIFCGFVAVCALNSQLSLKAEERNGMTVKQRLGGGPVLRLRTSNAGGDGVEYLSSLQDSGGSGMGGAGDADYWLEKQLIVTTTNSFKVLFRLKRASKPDERAIIVFPFNTVTETNWNGWHIHGKFL
jgi:hypothetical protein